MAKSYMGLAPGEGLGNLLVAIMGKPGDEAKRLQSTAYAANVRSEMDKRDSEIATLLMDRQGREAAAQAALNQSMSPAQRSAAFTAAGWRASNPGFLHNVPGAVLGQYAAGGGGDGGANVDEGVLSNLVAGAGHPFSSSPVGQARHETAETGRTGITAGAHLAGVKYSADRQAERGHVIGSDLVTPRGERLYAGPRDIAPGHLLQGGDGTLQGYNPSAPLPANNVRRNPDGSVEYGALNVAPDHVVIVPSGVPIPDSSLVTADRGADGQPSVVLGTPRATSNRQGFKTLGPNEAKAVDEILARAVPADVTVPPEALLQYRERAATLYGDPQSRTYGDMLGSATQAQRDVFGADPPIAGKWNPFVTNTVTPLPTPAPLNFTPGGTRGHVAAQGATQPQQQAPATPQIGGAAATAKPKQYSAETLIAAANLAIKEGRSTAEAARALLKSKGVQVQ
jgi:hypothetical protein